MSWTALPWCLAGALLVAGLVLLKTGLWPRRRGETPHCPACNYNLTGLTSEQCPECGTAVTASAIVFGERHRRPLRIMAGMTLLLIAAGLTVRLAGDVDWYSHYPSYLLISQFSSGQQPTNWKPWAELDRRIKAGRLSAGQHAKLIDVALKEQGAAGQGSLRRPLLDYLGECYSKGLMSQQQQTRFIDQFLTLRLSIRSTVPSGDDVPYMVHYDVRSPSKGMWYRLGLHKDVRIDGHTLPQGELSHRFACGDWQHGGGYGSTIAAKAYNKPGKHTLVVTPEVTILNGVIGDKQASTVLSTRRVPLETTFEVLAAEPSDYIRSINDPSLAPRIRAGITPREFRWHKEVDSEGGVTHTLYGEIRIESQPVDLAFDVIARINGKEYPAMTVTSLRGKPAHEYVVCEDAGPSQVPCVDVVLRSSKKAVRETLDQYEYWEGELIYKDVPVIMCPPAPGWMQLG